LFDSGQTVALAICQLVELLRRGRFGGLRRRTRREPAPCHIVREVQNLVRIRVPRRALLRGEFELAFQLVELDQDRSATAPNRTRRGPIACLAWSLRRLPTACRRPTT